MTNLRPLPNIKCPGIDSKYTPHPESKSRMCADTPPVLIFLYTFFLIKCRKIVPLPHTDQLNQYIVGKDRSPINDGNDSPQGFFLTVYCSTVLHVTLMYVKEPKEIVTGKLFHCQRVSEQNS